MEVKFQATKKGFGKCHALRSQFHLYARLLFVRQCTVLKNKNVYHVNNAIKLGQYNVGRNGSVLTIPLYMGFLIYDRIADVNIPEFDLSVLS